MRQSKRLGITLICLLVLGLAIAATASASELPDIHTILFADQYPIIMGGSVTGPVEGEIELANAVTSIPAEGVSTLLVASELSSLGALAVTFTGVHEKGNPASKCNSEGDAAGVVLFPNSAASHPEFHLVFTSYDPLPLQVGALVLFGPFFMTCAALEMELIGPFLGALVPTTEANGGSTELALVFHCANAANGIQELLTYWNDSAVLVTGTLLLALSGKAGVNSCEEIKPTILLKPEAGSASTMFSILPF